MAEKPTPRQPGDLILDRYMPNATPAEREEARENLRRLARLMVRMEARRDARNRDDAIRARGEEEVDYSGNT